MHRHGGARGAARDARAGRVALQLRVGGGRQLEDRLHPQLRLERVVDLRAPHRHRQRRDLHRRRVGVDVDDQPGQIVALAVDQAVGVGVRGRQAEACPRRARPLDPLAQERRVDRLVDPRAQAHRNLRARVVEALADEAPVVVGEHDTTSPGCGSPSIVAIALAYTHGCPYQSGRARPLRRMARASGADLAAAMVVTRFRCETGWRRCRSAGCSARSPRTAD